MLSGRRKKNHARCFNPGSSCPRPRSRDIRPWTSRGAVRWVRPGRPTAPAPPTTARERSAHLVWSRSHASRHALRAGRHLRRHGGRGRGNASPPHELPERHPPPSGAATVAATAERTRRRSLSRPSYGTRPAPRRPPRPRPPPHHRLPTPATAPAAAMVATSGRRGRRAAARSERSRAACRQSARPPRGAAAAALAYLYGPT